MKKIFLLFFTISVLLACKDGDKKTSSNSLSQDSLSKLNAISSALNSGESKPADPATVTTVEWLDTKELNMGKIVEGQELEVAFRFKNTGDKPLVISNVSAQCGCTIPETPKEPIAPAADGVIKAKFNSSNRGGSSNTKEVYVDANTDPGRTVLVFKVDVLKKDIKN